jgi:hypothetical protein
MGFPDQSKRSEEFTALKLRDVILSQSTAEAKNLIEPGTQPEILRPECIPAPNLGQDLRQSAGASE